MKVSEVYSIWIEYKKGFVKESSISAYWLLAKNHVMPFFGEMTDVSENEVQNFIIKKHKNGLSNKSISDALILLKMVLKFGHKKKIITFIEWTDLEYPRENKDKSLVVYNLKETNTLIKYVTDNFNFKNLGILITISTGVRIGEVCALQWSDIDLEKGVFKINKTIQRIYIDGKTKVIIDSSKTSSSNREIPISKELLRILKPIIKVVNNDYYVVTNDIKPLEPRGYRSYYHSLLMILELPIIKFHGLRHSFATRCINANVDIKTVSSLLGHSNITTTLNAYTHPDLEQKKGAINKMFKALGND